MKRENEEPARPSVLYSATKAFPEILWWRPAISTLLPASNGRTVRITATPARHGPPGIEAVSGEVTGFVLAFDDQPRVAVYVSGDTVWFEGVVGWRRPYRVRTWGDTQPRTQGAGWRGSRAGEGCSPVRST